jgi:hypothetical protein
MFDHKTDEQLEEHLTYLRRQLATHEKVVSDTAAEIRTTERALALRKVQAARIAAEADAPVFKKGDRVKTNNGFFHAVVSEVKDPPYADGKSVRLAIDNDRVHMDLGWWYRHQLAALTVEGE